MQVFTRNLQPFVTSKRNLSCKSPDLNRSIGTQKKLPRPASALPSDTRNKLGFPDRRKLQIVVAKERRKGYFSETPDFAQLAEKARILAMEFTPEGLRSLPVHVALSKWWNEVKKPTVRKLRTIEAYELYLKRISESGLAKVLVSQLHHGHLLEYQRHRRLSVCVSYVNHETNMLAQMLNYCDMWTHIGKHFKQLPPPPWRPPKVLTTEEEERFFKVASSNTEWEVAYWAVSLTNNTSAMGVELRTLQLKHIFITGEWEHNPKIHVSDDTAKNQFRARVVPLNDRALRRVKAILVRAKKYGAHLPEHYIFPKYVKRGVYDPTQPASRSFITKAFKGMRKATGMEWLQPRFFRNQVITRLFENGVPDETIMSIAGHQSINMSRYYSQIRLGAKKEALSALCAKPGVKHG